MARISDFNHRRAMNWQWLGVLLFFILLLACAHSAFAQSPAPAPLILTDASGEYSLAPHLEILRDPTHQLTIQDVTSPAFSERFAPNRQALPNLGLTTDAVWVRFRVQNHAVNPTRWLLGLHEQRVGQVDAYLPTGNETFRLVQTGRDLPFASRDVPHREYIFSLDVPAGVERTVYLRLRSASPVIFPLTIWTTAALAQRDQNDLLFYGLFYGAMLIMAGYNLFLFFSLRDESYLYLTLFILFYSLSQGARDGLAHQYVYPTVSNRYGNELFTVLFTIFLILFSTRFLETRTRVPQLHRLLIAIALMLVLWFFFTLVVSFNAIGLILFESSLVLMGLAGFSAWRQGYRPARFYLLSWMFFFVSAFLYVANGFALLTDFSFSDKPLLIGIVIATLLGSLALADRVNTLRTDTENASRELERSERKYRSLFDHSRDGIFIVTRDGTFLDVNPVWLEMFGLARAELVQRNATDFYVDAAERRALLHAIDTNGFAQDFSVRLRRADGTVMQTLISATVWEDASAGRRGYQGVVRDVTAQRRIEQELAQQQMERAQAVAEERSRLARELHDSVTQSLYSIGLYANAAGRALQVGKQATGSDHIQQIIQLALEAMVDMRALIFELRPPALDKVGLAAALQTRLQAVEGRAGIAVEFHTAGNDGLAPGVQTELYRIAQEALSNVVKHAHAKHLAVNLLFEPRCATLEIRDDGEGIDLSGAQLKNTMGLRSMMERAEKIHGTLTVEGKRGEGTVVRVEVSNGSSNNSPEGNHSAESNDSVVGG